jgi:DNA/RNA endonuclease YhcR with UshA esterase domain
MPGRRPPVHLKEKAMRNETQSVIAALCGRAILVLALGIALPVSAHHSFSAVYDLKKPVTVKGTIVKVRLTNPHSWFYIDVKNDKGDVEHWAFEAGTPSGMIRNGYKASVIKTGDEVTVTGFHALDASQNMGMLRQLTTADGKVYGLFGPQESPAAK